MPNFIFSYRHPANYLSGGVTENGGQRLVEVEDDARVAWTAYFDRIAPNIVDPGQPVFERTSIGEVGVATKLGGYSVVKAADLAAAVALAKECPLVDLGGGVEIGVLAELPPDHPAALLKDQLAGG
jgi:hypothetical protein